MGSHLYACQGEVFDRPRWRDRPKNRQSHGYPPGVQYEARKLSARSAGDPCAPASEQALGADPGDRCRPSARQAVVQILESRGTSPGARNLEKWNQPAKRCYRREFCRNASSDIKACLTPWLHQNNAIDATHREDQHGRACDRTASKRVVSSWSASVSTPGPGRHQGCAPQGAIPDHPLRVAGSKPFSKAHPRFSKKEVFATKWYIRQSTTPGTLSAIYCAPSGCAARASVKILGGPKWAGTAEVF